MQIPVLDHFSSNTHAGATNTLSWTQILGQGNFPYLVVAVQGRTTGSGNVGNNVVNGVTFNGIAMKRLNASSDWLYQSPSQVGSAQKQRLSLWYLTAADLVGLAPGSYTITATWAGNTDTQVGVSATFFNCRQQFPEAGPVQATDTSAGGPRTLTNNITTLTLNALIISLGGAANGGGMSVPAPQTFVTQSSDNGTSGAVCISYLVQATPATIAISTTHGNPESLAQGIISIPFLTSPFGGIM